MKIADQRWKLRWQRLLAQKDRYMKMIERAKQRAAREAAWEAWKEKRSAGLQLIPGLSSATALPSSATAAAGPEAP